MELGSLICVGSGMTLGAHITPRAKSAINNADVVFSLQSNSLVEAWINQMHPDVRSLQHHYADGKDRRQSYDEMCTAIIAEVKAGKNVCAVFYGHPGVFALVPHKSIRLAKDLGARAFMEPGISAEDCLFADLGIDPGKFGCQQFEASQFLLYERQPDTYGYVILWQPSIAGNHSHTSLTGDHSGRQALIATLAKSYPETHNVILYEAATIPLETPRKEEVPLGSLADCRLNMKTTLVIPPAKQLVRRKKD